MGKSLKYFISVFLLGMLACSQDPPLDFSHLSPVERQQMTIRLDSILQMYPHGSVNRHAFYDTLIALNPTVEAYYREKAIPYNQLGDIHLGFPLMEKAAALDPRSALNYYCWLLLYQYRDYERALMRLNQYDDMTPDQTDAVWGRNIHFLKGIVRKQLGHQPTAIKEFSICVEEDGENVDTYVYVYRGICHHQMKDYDQAIADFDTAIADYDKCTMAFYYKALTLLEMDRKEEALLCLKKAEDLLKKGYKQTDPYVEIFDEVHLEMVEDQLKNWDVPEE